MKKIILLLFGILVCFSNCKKETIILKPINHLKKFSNTTEQSFNLDTLEYFNIKGKYGTEIIFFREDFEIPKNEKIKAELIEIYDFNDLIFNNINTITKDNDLLESSGVIFIDFKSKNKSISLKEGKSLRVIFPENKLDNNELFTAKVDTLNQFKWIEETQKDTVFSISIGGGIFKEIIIKKDSIDYYKNVNLKGIGAKTYEEYVDLLYENEYTEIKSISLIKNMGWINIDKIVNPDFNLSFNLELNQEINNLSIYFIYENLNSFISEYRTKDNLFFKDIPIKDKTQILVLGKENNKFFADKFNLDNKLQKSKIKINLREMKIEDIKEHLTK